MNVNVDDNYGPPTVLHLHTTEKSSPNKGASSSKTSNKSQDTDVCSKFSKERFTPSPSSAHGNKSSKKKGTYNTKPILPVLKKSLCVNLFMKKFQLIL